MAFRSSRRRGTRRPRKKAIWVNIPFGSVAFSETAGSQLLLTPEDWEAQFSGTGNETAVLRAIVGEITWQQLAVGTAGTTAFWCIYVNDKDATVVPTFTVADLGDIDILRVGAIGTSNSVTNSLSATALSGIKIDIRAKRRLKSRDAIRIVAQFGADAATPTGVLGGILRFLIARD